MIPARAGRPALAVLAFALAAGALLPACAHRLRTSLVQNLRPTVRLTHAPIDSADPEFYIYRMNWTGFDPDGRVVRFEYVVDPPDAAGSDTDWVWTTKNEQVITFRASIPDPVKAGGQARARDFHVFVIRAVDNGGLCSEPAVRAFFSFGVAPSVQILEPAPSTLLTPVVAPAVRISWTGKDYLDKDGYVFDKPVRYKYKLYQRGPGASWDRWVVHPDSMRADLAPAFAGWDSCGGDTTSIQFTNLTPNGDYLFVIVAFSRAGAYSPVFSLNSNMLRMSVGYSGVSGPKLTLYNSYFSYTYPSGGFPSGLDPSWAIPLQVPAEQTVTFHWTARVSTGSSMRRYRWALDILDWDDEHPRTSDTDWSHWSDWSLLETSATVGPFRGSAGDTGEVHNFYVEAEDINSLVSLGWVQFRVFRPTFDRGLLVVDDTRYNVDQVSKARKDSLIAPNSTWPTRSELDTFLFAVGNVRWRMTPDGTLSPRGVFAGYPFDSIGTRNGRENPTFPLALLGHYRYVVWLMDLRGSRNEGRPSSPTEPITALRFMSGGNTQNTLATWVTQGGHLWALGGGFANATNDPWNLLQNDTQVCVYTSAGQYPDLLPGRFMYDLAHWRSEYRVFGNAMVSFARYDQPDPTIGPSPPPVYWRGGHWSGTDVDYSALPPTLMPRDPTTDPIWPLRSPTDFYVGNRRYSPMGFNIEYLTAANEISEPVPGSGGGDSTVATLDTLYHVYGPAYQSPSGQLVAPARGVNVVMTRYRGNDPKPGMDLVFTGVDLWNFRRSDVQGVVDFVLGRLWGLPKAGTRAFAGRVPPTKALSPGRAPSPGGLLPAHVPSIGRAGERGLFRPAKAPPGR